MWSEKFGCGGVLGKASIGPKFSGLKLGADILGIDPKTGAQKSLLTLNSVGTGVSFDFKLSLFGGLLTENFPIFAVEKFGLSGQSKVTALGVTYTVGK